MCTDDLNGLISVHLSFAPGLGPKKLMVQSKTRIRLITLKAFLSFSGGAQRSDSFCNSFFFPFFSLCVGDVTGLPSINQNWNLQEN